ncbi:Hypothetical protein AA314_01370 [Archangium gephyra]|uniref:Uncharacterized protein n=1 Tax=Archangium gephyra TaxID=48 RepID=A0AAC8Q2J8_9BACT|nr:Hypothetical protein AA314_01370 [Archangium gephyra]
MQPAGQGLGCAKCAETLGAGRCELWLPGHTWLLHRLVSLVTGDKWNGPAPFHWSPVTSGMHLPRFTCHR